MAGLVPRLPLLLQFWRQRSLQSSFWSRALLRPEAAGCGGWTAKRPSGRSGLFAAPCILHHVSPVPRSASSWAAAAGAARKKPADPQKLPSATGPRQGNVSDSKRLLALAYPERWRLTAAIGFLAVSSVITMSAPFFLGKVIDVIYTNPTPELVENLSSLCALLSGIFLCGAAANAIRVYLMQISGQRIVKRLRATIYSSLLKQEVAFFDKTSTGELINRLSSDTALLGRSVTENLSDGLRAGAQASAAIGMMFFVSPKLATFVLSVVPPLAVTAVVYGTYLRKLTRKTQDSLAEATQIAEERIGNLRTVRAFGHELNEMEKYENKVDYVLQLAKKEATARAGFFGAGNTVIKWIQQNPGVKILQLNTTL